MGRTIQNVRDFVDAIDNGELDINPVKEMRDLFDRVSGKAEIDTDRLPMEFCDEMRERIREKLGDAHIRDLSLEDLYSFIAGAGKPVSLTIEDEKGKKQWISLAADSENMVEKAMSSADSEVRDRIIDRIRKTAASDAPFSENMGEISVSCKNVPVPPAKGRFAHIFKNIVAPVALATVMFLNTLAFNPVSSFAADASSQPVAVEQTVKMKKNESKSILHTIAFCAITTMGEKIKMLNPDAQDKYLDSDSIQKQLAEMADKSTVEKLNFVNKLINKFKYISDIKNWKQKDFWASPQKMMEKGGGDCEDYAIAKYLMLRKLGISEDDMFIMVGVYANNQGHAMLAVYDHDSDQFYILDNNSSKLQTEKSMDNKFLPIYSLNEKKAWNNLCRSDYSETAKKRFPLAQQIRKANKKMQVAAMQPKAGTESGMEMGMGM